MPDTVQPFQFQRDEDGSLSLETAVFQALGAASTCWDSLADTGVFHSERAKEIGEALLEHIRTEHDNKGYSEEKCIRCGWVMGQRPLNCNNDNTPHVFPSQVPTPPPPLDEPVAVMLHGTTDTQVWAREWCRIARELFDSADGRVIIDEGWMIGWFANAIEVGRLAGA